MTRRYKAFISYSWADKDWGAWVHRSLETYRAPKGVADGQSLHPIFKDREEEAAGGSVGAAIEAALEASENLIVICSPRSAKSQWVNREVAWFKTHKDKGRVLALIVDGEPGHASDDCFPKALTRKIGPDLQPTDEWEDAPLAADARPEGDGKRGAKLKLAAALLGVGLDDLVRRDERRRTIRRRLVTTAALGLSAAMSVLAFVAVTQRDAAVSAELMAQAAQQDAEFQRDEAQSLVEFMLTDLRQRLDAVGRLDILDAVARRLLESYARQDLEALDPDSLGRRARVLLLLGEVEGTRGKLDDALDRYREAAAATQELLRRDPDDQKRIFDHAQSVYWVGDIALRRGDMATVTDYWTQYRDFGARLVALDPDKDEWKTELAYGHRNLASLAFDRGDMTTAVAGFRLAGDITRALAKKSPDDRVLQMNNASDLQWLALAQERRGAFSEAASALAEEEAIYDRLLAKEPADDAVLQKQAVNRRVRGRIAVASGDVSGGLALLGELFPLHESRLSAEPDNTRWLHYYGMLQVDSGGLHLIAGDIEQARLLAGAAMNTADRLVSIDKSAVDWQIDIYCGARLLAARVELAGGKREEARRYLDETATAVGKIVAVKDRYVLDQIYIKIDVLRARLAERSGALRAGTGIPQERMRAIESALPKSGFENKTVFVEAWLLAGDVSKARNLAAELAAAGYRHPDFISLRKQLAALEGRERAPRGN